MAVAVPTAALATPTQAIDCRYEAPPLDATQPTGGVLFPDGGLFTPPIADAKEPRWSLGYRWVDFFRGQEFPTGDDRGALNTGQVSGGGVFGLWGHRAARVCDGIQVSLFAAVFSQFNLDARSQDLLNTDFIVGTQVSGRQGRLSGRVRFYHLSSHLGDEFILNNPLVTRANFGFEAIDALVSYDGDRWRVYGGAGYLFFLGGRTSPGYFQGGAEIRDRMHGQRRLSRVLALDINMLEARALGVTMSLGAGIEWTSPEATRRLRALVVARNGFLPFGQFSNRQRLRNIGVELQFDY